MTTRTPLHVSAFAPVITRGKRPAWHGRALAAQPHRVVRVAQIIETGWPTHCAPYDDALVEATWCAVPTLITAMVQQRGNGRRVTALRLWLADAPLDAGTRRALHTHHPRVAWFRVVCGDAFVVPTA